MQDSVTMRLWVIRAVPAIVCAVFVLALVASPAQASSQQSDVICASPHVQDKLGVDTGTCGSNEKYIGLSRSTVKALDASAVNAILSTYVASVYKSFGIESGLTNTNTVDVGVALTAFFLGALTNPDAAAADRSTSVFVSPYPGTQVVEARVPHVECDRSDTITYRLEVTQSPDLTSARIDSLSVIVDNSTGIDDISVNYYDIRGIKDSSTADPSDTAKIDDNNQLTHEGNELVVANGARLSFHKKGQSSVQKFTYKTSAGWNSNQPLEVSNSDIAKPRSILIKTSSTQNTTATTCALPDGSRAAITIGGLDRVTFQFVAPNQAKAAQNQGAAAKVEDDPFLDAVGGGTGVSGNHSSGQLGTSSGGDFISCFDSGMSGIGGWGSLFTLAFTAGEDAFVPANYASFASSPDLYTSWTSNGMYNLEWYKAGQRQFPSMYNTTFGSAAFQPTIDTRVTLRFSGTDDTTDGALRRVQISNQIYDVFESCSQNFEFWSDSQKVLMSQLTMFSDLLFDELEKDYSISTNKFYRMFSTGTPQEASIAVSAMSREEFATVVYYCGLQQYWTSLFATSGPYMQISIPNVPNLVCNPNYHDIVKMEIARYRAVSSGSTRINGRQVQGELDPVPCLSADPNKMLRDCEHPDYKAMQTGSDVTDAELATLRADCITSGQPDPDDLKIFYVPAGQTWNDNFAGARSLDCREYWRGKILRTNGYLLWTEAEVRAKLQQCHLSKWDGFNRGCTGLIGNLPYVEALETRLKDLGAREFDYLDDQADKPIPPPAHTRPSGHTAPVTPQPLCEGGGCAG